MYTLTVLLNFFVFKQKTAYEIAECDWSADECSADFNLYKGFNVVSKKGDWSLFRNHIRDVICSGNEEHFDYLIKWMARIVQDTGGDRPGIAVVLRGGRGVGKSIF